MFQRLDRAYSGEVIARLVSLKPDTKPRWGKSTPAQILGHLTDAVRYCQGAGPEIPFKGSWKAKYVFKPLLINQLVAIPHNVRLPKRDGSARADAFREGTLDELKAALDEYLSRADAGTLTGRMHPFFGFMTSTQWLKFHRAHFKHHLGQFGL